MCNIRYDWSYLLSALFCVYKSYIILLFKETSPHTILKQSRSPKRDLLSSLSFSLFKNCMHNEVFDKELCWNISDIFQVWVSLLTSKVPLETFSYRLLDHATNFHLRTNTNRKKTILKTCCACCDSNAAMFILCWQRMNSMSVKLQFAQWNICLYIRITPVD